jgi:phosphoglycerol transferase MdoB-like AlkP superfamily enzyme
MLKTGIVRFIIVLGFALLLNIICRQLLFFFNKDIFQVSAGEFFHYLYFGIRFDISALAYANTLFVFLYFLPFPFRHKRFFRIILFWSWLIPNMLILIPNIADAFYFPFVFKRSTYDVLGIIFAMKSEMNTLWTSYLTDFWPAYFILAVFIVGSVYMYKVIIRKDVPVYRNLKQYLTGSVVLIVCSVLTVIGMRGGLQTKPISLITAGKYAPPHHTPLVLNSAFSMIRTYGKQVLEKKHFFEDKEMMTSYFNVSKQLSNNTLEKKNIVVIILESFSNEHLNSVNETQVIAEGKNFAPFLDSLIHEGYFFPNAFANGKRSVEGIPAIISSMPTLMNTPFILSPYINNNFSSLPDILKSLGYISYFFHGGENGTMNFDAYSKVAGFDQYFGKSEYPDKSDFDGKWGIWDEPYLNYVARQLDETTQPFLATIFTLSSHHPYNVPEKYKSLLPEGPLPIHKAVAYADLSLRRFFDEISHSQWYSNTLFVITSDHSSEPYLEYYKGFAGRYSIPLLFFDPGSGLRGVNPKICQQTDILPSVLDYIGYSGALTAFGNSVFDSTYSGISITYLADSYQIITDSTALIIADDQALELFLYKTDYHATHNLIDNPIYRELVKFKTNLYKSYVQQYNNSLIENSMNDNEPR